MMTVSKALEICTVHVLNHTKNHNMSRF